MDTFYVTESAGAKIAGMANPGVGQPIKLSSVQAQYYLRTGELTRTPPSAPEKPAKGKSDGRN